MSAHVKILKGDLHLLVSTAFNRGRYVLMTGGGDGQPIEITIDLRERPDDLFGGGEVSEATDLTEYLPESLKPGAFPDAPRREDIGKWKPFSTDDHGPAIPAQGGKVSGGAPVYPYDIQDAVGFEPGPRVYEFALQDATVVVNPKPTHLDDVYLGHAPDLQAASEADWVHVYDRVTRERRTLKRPEADAVLTGLRDVAADLRQKTYPEKADEHLRGLPVEPPFGCAPLPPVGPLTSTEGLKPGDVLRVIEEKIGWGYGLVKVLDIKDRDHWQIQAEGDREIVGLFSPDEVSFVGRPDADGWMAWAGGENPVPGAVVKVIFRDGQHLEAASDILDTFWPHKEGDESIDRFQIVDTPPAV